MTFHRAHLIAALTVLAAWAQAFGATLTITSTPPGATVFIDSKWAGVTPAQKQDLPPGEHRVKLVRHGYQTWAKVITVAQEPAAVNAELKAIASGSIKVTSEPAGADVFLDGEPVGKTPLALDELDAGEYEVRAQAVNHMSQTRKVEIADGAAAAVHFTLGRRTIAQVYIAEIEQDPTNIEAHAELAHMYLVNRQYDEAIAAFREGISAASAPTVRPSKIQKLFSEIKKVYRGQYDYGDAAARKRVRESLDKIILEAVEKGTPNSYTFRQLLQLTSISADADAVTSLCARVLAKNPRSHVCRGIAKLYLERGLAEDAIKLLRQEIASHPDDFEARYTLGTAYHRMDKLAEAEAEYAAAAKLDAPKSELAHVHEMRARLAARTQDHEKAALAWNMAAGLTFDPVKAAGFRLSMVRELLKLGKIDEAEDTCKDIIEKSRIKFVKERAGRMLLRVQSERAAAGKK